eukprot:c8240_g1_i2.p1 GENE.c8240_g1_i2~~c8240_g1_i2.p1  ORF type:complete len:406 (+),score=88.33 c8240_g1_i2:152-1369(+)
MKQHILSASCMLFALAFTLVASSPNESQQSLAATTSEDHLFVKEVNDLSTKQPIGIVKSETNQPTNLADLQRRKNPQASTPDVFEATHEWKPIKRGQAIPPGLHVRLDLTTGERLAKLLDTPDTSQNTKTEMLPPALILNADMISHHETYIETNFNKFTVFRYPEAMANLRGVLVGLNHSCEVAVPALANLADILDDIDQSKDLAKAGALRIMYLASHPQSPCVTHPEVADAALRALGSAVHNNPDVQQIALSDGLMSLALQLLTDATHIHLDHNFQPIPFSDENIARVGRVVYVVSSMLSHSTDAQSVFSNSVGWQRLIHFVSLLADTETLTPTKSSTIRKIFALLYDIQMENDEETNQDWLEHSKGCQQSGHCFIDMCGALRHVILSEHSPNDLFEQVIIATS